MYFMYYRFLPTIYLYILHIVYFRLCIPHESDIADMNTYFFFKYFFEGNNPNILKNICSYYCTNNWSFLFYFIWTINICKYLISTFIWNRYFLACCSSLARKLNLKMNDLIVKSLKEKNSSEIRLILNVIVSQTFS